MALKRIKHYLFLLPISALFWQCSEGAGNGTERQKRTTPTLAVEAIVLQAQVLENKISATGTIIANEEVELKSEVSRKVTKIHFIEGSRVKRGELLVKLDDRDLIAQLRKFRVAERFSKQDSSRQAQLLEVSATTQEVYDGALNRLMTAQADIELVKVQIEKTEIRSPLNGIIGLRQISEGSYLTPSVVISIIQEVDPVKLEFKVPEKYAGQVSKDMEVNFRMTNSQKEFHSVIYAIEPKIDFATRTVTVRAKSSNPNLELLPGGFAQIEIVLNKMNDALLVPSQAVIPDLNGQTVYLYKSGKVRRMAVDLGVRLERTVQLSSGVNPMDTVITTGLLQVREGMSIDIKRIVTLEN